MWYVGSDIIVRSEPLGKRMQKTRRLMKCLFSGIDVWKRDFWFVDDCFVFESSIVQRAMI